MSHAGFLITYICFLQHRESQAFIEKYEGTLGKVKGRKLYTCKVMVMKVSGPDLKCNIYHVHGTEVEKCVSFSTNSPIYMFLHSL